jgi:anhydro-N-acetylmuramic acid kinase
MADTCIGLMSGTSMDGIDAVLVNIGHTSLRVLETLSFKYPEQLQQRLRAAVSTPLDREIDNLEALHRETGECFRDAVIALVRQADFDPSGVTVIGSHGQTLRHEPDIAEPYSLQVGDPSVIATGAGIPVVADFRSADIEAGGQGAPLVPPFHRWLFHNDAASEVVVNIGGIANVTILPTSGHATGFDTGPGNTLMDGWTRENSNARFDAGGEFAASGKVDRPLLQRLLSDPYFSRRPPKSTGLEHFNLGWLRGANIDGLAAADVQATLCELTATSIADAIRSAAPDTDTVFVCGGGVHNAELMRRLEARLAGTDVLTTDAVGLDPDWVEAAAFAWLALRTINGLPGNLPSVTGASRPAVLGTIHQP